MRVERKKFLWDNRCGGDAKAEGRALKAESQRSNCSAERLGSRSHSMGWDSQILTHQLRNEFQFTAKTAKSHKKLLPMVEKHPETEKR
jgi:hypothetical protein